MDVTKTFSAQPWHRFSCVNEVGKVHSFEFSKRTIGLKCEKQCPVRSSTSRSVLEERPAWANGVLGPTLAMFINKRRHFVVIGEGLVRLGL